MPNWCIEEVREFPFNAVPSLTPLSQYLTKALPHIIIIVPNILHLIRLNTINSNISLDGKQKWTKTFLVLKLHLLNLNSQTIFITINLNG